MGMPLMGGDLFDVIQKCAKFTELDARRIAVQLASTAIRWLFESSFYSSIFVNIFDHFSIFVSTFNHFSIVVNIFWPFFHLCQHFYHSSISVDIF